MTRIVQLVVTKIVDSFIREYCSEPVVDVQPAYDKVTAING